jgi:hypothetical protein
MLGKDKTMYTPLTYRQHVQNLDDLISTIREAQQNEDYESIDPLCIDIRITKRVWLTFGGPNEYIDFSLDDHGSYYSCISAVYVHVWGSDRVEYQLSEEEADELFYAYGLEFKA